MPLALPKMIAEKRARTANYCRTVLAQADPPVPIKRLFRALLSRGGGSFLS